MAQCLQDKIPQTGCSRLGHNEALEDRRFGEGGSGQSVSDLTKGTRVTDLKQTRLRCRI